MKSTFFILLSFIFFACSKTEGNDPVLPPIIIPPPPSPPTDTLSTGWRKIMLPVSQVGADIFFINNTTGFLAGGNFISRSTDGGNTWQRVYQSAGKFENVTMGSHLNAIFTTINETGSGPSKIITTSDGGNTFDRVLIADYINDAFFVSSSVAYALGQKCWKTINCGLSWTNLYSFAVMGQGNYRSYYFLNEQTGWWAGGGGVYKTSNAGVNWSSMPLPDFNFSTLGNVFFADNNTGYITDLNSVGKSTNGGTTWNKVYTLQNNIYHDLHFLTPALGYVTDKGYVYKTADAGISWTREVKLQSTTDVLIEMHFTDANHGWAIGNTGLSSTSLGFVLKYER